MVRVKLSLLLEKVVFPCWMASIALAWAVRPNNSSLLLAYWNSVFSLAAPKSRRMVLSA